MFPAETIVDVRDDGYNDDGSNAEGCTDEAKKGTIWVVEIYKSPYQ
jgi:hypothetical protein